jgi:hypothetical protein
MIDGNRNLCVIQILTVILYISTIDLVYFVYGIEKSEHICAVQLNVCASSGFSVK